MGRHFIRRMANKINSFGEIIRTRGAATALLVCCLLLSTGCQQLSSPVSTTETKFPQGDGVTVAKVKGMILPHHLLVSAYIDKFYTEIARENSYDRVVILSPNHFGYGFNYVQTTDQVEGVKGAEGVALDRQSIKLLDESDLAAIEPKDFGQEHGIYVHYPFVKKYFPEAKIVPITVKNNTSCIKLDELAAKLEELDQLSGGKTLFLASLDFTHYSAESLAAQNDWRTIKWLETPPASADLCESSKMVSASLDTETPDAVAIDSAPVIYLMTKLMKDSGSGNFQLWARTSSCSMIKSLPGKDNTSHIFGYYPQN